MTQPKYSIRDRVRLTGGIQRRSGAPGGFEIVRILPAERGEYLYRIKSIDEVFERVAAEHELLPDRESGSRSPH
jgi:hypothetical protein